MFQRNLPLISIKASGKMKSLIRSSFVTKVKLCFIHFSPQTILKTSQKRFELVTKRIMKQHFFIQLYFSCQYNTIQYNTIQINSVLIITLIRYKVKLPLAISMCIYCIFKVIIPFLRAFSVLHSILRVLTLVH